MRFAAINTGSANWIRAGRDAANKAGRIAESVTENSTDFGQMAEAWQNAQQSKELNAIKAQTDMFNTGIDAVTDKRIEDIEFEIGQETNKREVKQKMAGKLAAFGGTIAESFKKDPPPTPPATVDPTELATAEAEIWAANGFNPDGTRRTNPDTDTNTEVTTTNTSTDNNNGSNNSESSSDDSSSTRTLPTPTADGATMKLDFDGVYSLAANTGIQFPELVAAQWQLETGGTSGQGPTANNNIFAQKGNDFTADTQEYSNGSMQFAPGEGWKSYDSPQAATDWLVNNWYRDSDKHGQGALSLGGGTLEGTANALVTLGYATDPEYATKLLRIVRERGY